LARPSPPSDLPGAERKLVTVLLIDVDEAREGFADVDPEDAGRSLSGRLARVRAEVEAHGGVVEETLGGRSVAVFGIPRTRDDDAERAVRAALAVRDTLAREAPPELRVQAAVVTGEALVRPGEGGRGRQRVTGDPLAAATRLQETVPAGTVLVSETTRRATERAIAYGPAGRARPGAGEPLTAWPALAPRTGPASPSRRFPPLVARDRELDALLAATARAAAGGGPALVTVVGAAGIGKSRLLAELADLLAAGALPSGDHRQVAWRQGRALPYGDGPSFGALAEAVKAEAGILESDGAELAGRRLVAAAGPGPGGPAPGRRRPARLRRGPG
jgi:class 3 adenylate cyclase